MSWEQGISRFVHGSTWFVTHCNAVCCVTMPKRRLTMPMISIEGMLHVYAPQECWVARQARQAVVLDTSISGNRELTIMRGHYI